jgi:hypoxia up-regulated 1
VAAYGSELSPINVRACPDDAQRTIRTVLFPVGSKLGLKKTMTFKKSSDFDLSFRTASNSYDDISSRCPPFELALISRATFGRDWMHRKEPSEPLFDLSISGLSATLSNLTEAESTNSTVKVTVHLTESDIVTAPQAVLVLPEKGGEDNTMAGRLKGLFGHKADKDEAAPAGNDSTAETPKSQAASKKAAEPLPLRVETRPTGVLPLSKDELAEAKKRSGCL